MEPEKDDASIEDELKKRFLQLPQPLRKAIISADIEDKLHKLSESHKLHLDQWQKLENEVMLALLGFQQVEKLEENIKNEVGVSAEIASALAGDIADTIFLPIREELERELGPAPEKEEGESAVDEVRKVSESQAITEAVPAGGQSQLLAANSANTLLLLPATPPPPPKTEKSVRAPIAESYTSQIPSHERKAIEGDPYREAIV
ncbi:MAG: hypothetical protein Q7S75_02340 [bacterium]|nr:hypothetical protein [bacterium]